jgi:uncharacterized membrane protein
MGTVRPGDRAAASTRVAGDCSTIEQDPGLALRIMVDVAIRALSPAVNDPTTAVQVLDHLENLLRAMGASRIRSTVDVVDAQGPLRLRMPGRSWAEYLALGVTEIRLHGNGSVQVARRLRALLERLVEHVLPEHRRAVEDELRRLDIAVAESFAGSVDADRAQIPDSQGIGGTA